MESVRYLRALRRSWWVVLLVAVVAVAAGALLFWRTPASYSTGIQMLATTSGRTDSDDQSGTGAGSATYIASQAQAYAQLASTPPAVSDAATAAGYPGATPTVVASANGADPFLSIAVTDADPDVARAVANAYPDTLPATTTRLSGALPIAVTLTVLSPAPLPASPVSPILWRYLLLSAAVGLVVGVGVALGRGYLDRTLRDSEELEAVLELPVLATIPSELGHERVPATTHPRSARAEAYRQIRTSLQNPALGADGGPGGGGQGPAVLLVTSAAAGEGKTTTAVNLAVTLRQAGQRVALVDADLRRPQVARSLGLEDTLGLAHVLAGTATLAQAVHVDDSGTGVLTVLGAGSIPDNPSEALGSAAMLQTLTALRRDHDVVVVDSPPVIPVTDALVLAPHVDAVVLVVRLGLVRRDKVRRAKTVIDRVRGQLVGVVANGADTSRDRYYRYAYAYHGDAPTMSVDLEAALARRDGPGRHARDEPDTHDVTSSGPARIAATPVDPAPQDPTRGDTPAVPVRPAATPRKQGAARANAPELAARMTPRPNRRARTR